MSKTDGVVFMPVSSWRFMAALLAAVNMPVLILMISEWPPRFDYSVFYLLTFLISIFITLPAILIFGIPVTLQLARRGWLNWWTLLATGSLGGLGVAVAFHLFDLPVAWEMVAFCAASGCLVAGVFAWITKMPMNQRLN